jgi:LmbE family N-acetylglucosaminyl deacetylase
VVQFKLNTALFVSPHLDDAAFSCGGTMIKFAREGWRTILCTVFTASVANPQGFALACQTDKGLSPEVDYMALRRREDADFAEFAKCSLNLWLDLREAPHRGYESAPDLFAGVHHGDEIWRDISAKLGEVISAETPDLIFAPQGLGNHVDHLQTIAAVLDVQPSMPIWWYRDTPYAIRYSQTQPSELLPKDLSAKAVDISAALEDKITACCLYTTQIGFQFGGAEKLADTLHHFHAAEAEKAHTNFASAEIFLACDTFEKQ